MQPITSPRMFSYVRIPEQAGDQVPLLDLVP